MSLIGWALYDKFWLIKVFNIILCITYGYCVRVFKLLCSRSQAICQLKNLLLWSFKLKFEIYKRRKALT